jgi:type VI secretion system protein ImpK
MREDLADAVHRILQHGVRLRDRLGRGEQPDIDTEQALLKSLLSQVGPDARAADAGASGIASTIDIRYALVCWLDETLILHSPWGSRWMERRLEFALYNTAVGGNRFVELAERATGDALEVFFLCVMLGFRGRWGEGTDRDRLRVWAEAARAQLMRGQRRECPLLPSGLEPEAHVPPLHNREKLRQLAPAWVAVLSLLVLVLMLSVVQFWFRNT